MMARTKQRQGVDRRESEELNQSGFVSEPRLYNQIDKILTLTFLIHQ